MSKKCELTGKIPMKGHNVSHANNKTNRRFLPNLKKTKFKSELLKRSLTLTVSNAGVRCVDKKGTFDEFLKNGLLNYTPIKRVKPIHLSIAFQFFTKVLQIEYQIAAYISATRNQLINTCVAICKKL